MNTRHLIATSVLAISATVPALALADNPTSHGDGTDHVAQQSEREQVSRQAVLNEYQKALKTGEFNPIAGDASKVSQIAKSTVTRAQVLSKINGVDLTEGDAS